MTAPRVGCRFQSVEGPTHKATGIHPNSLCLLLVLFSLAYTLSWGGEKVLRIGWLSDTHVGSPTGAADLSAAVRAINEDHSIAFTILTGDVTEMGSDAELQLAKSLLDSLLHPYFLVPGNHDTKWSESGCTMFPQLWGADKFVHAAGPFLFIGMHEGPIMRMGDGHVAPEDLRWLDSVLSARSGDERIVFVTHYPVDRGIDNWEQIANRLARVPTAAILCGHGHANAVLDAEGIPMLMGRSTLRRPGKAPGWTLIRLSRDSIVCSEQCPNTSIAPWCAEALGPKRSIVTPGHAAHDLSPPSQSTATTAWTVETGWTITASPLVLDGNLLVGDRSGRLVCLRASDGSQEWSVNTGGPLLATVAAAEGIVVVTTARGAIIGLRATDGKELWRQETSHPIVAVPVVADSRVFVGSSEGVFRALDLHNGQVIWKYTGIGGFVETRPVIYGGLVIFGAWDTKLYALNARTGTLAWTWSNGNPSRLFSPAACWPVASHGKVFIVAPDRAMTALDAATGQTVWRSTAYRVRESIGLSADSNTVYARCMTDTLLAVSSASPHFRLEGITTCGYGYDIDPSMPVERDGTITFGTKNGLVIGVDAANRTVRWTHRVGVTIVNTPAPLPGGRVVVTDADGRITMIQERRP
jgi:outer membrane protein assembly factor BamB/predicted phosphodiesterase